MKIVAVFLLFLLFLCKNSAAPSPSPSSSACPVDLNYVRRIPWNSSACQNFKSLSSKSEASSNNCCISLLSLFGIGLAQHLKETSNFNLPNLQTSNSCIQDFQAKLSALSLPNNLASSCFDPLQFVISPNICAGVENISDWTSKLGQSTPLNTACRSDLMY